RSGRHPAHPQPRQARYPSTVCRPIRSLEDDEITIYGVSKGLYTYKSTLGGNITIPLVGIEKIEQ
ncbi:MAG: hypothetical protein IKG22_00325, partial [Atopobiaceae bacterium]|nr:hypothetical protein [Atopobiaceae bacterium]